MSNKTILFADDSATMRTIMEKTFSAEPYDVVTVPSGEAAIATAREIKPSIVIADAGMAGVSGYDVCKAIRKDPALAGTPVILMAGVSNPYDEGRGASVGASEYIKKPFDTTQLIQAVGTLAATVVKRPAAAASAPVAQAAPAPAPAAIDPLAPPSFRSKAVAPVAVKPERPRPFAAPAEPPAKKAIDFGAMAPPQKLGFKNVEEPLEAEEPEPEPLEPEEEEIYEPEPIESEEEEFQAKPVEGGPFRSQPREVQPIQSIPADGEPISFDPNVPADANAFTVSTLAEMAQLDERGAQVKPEPIADAIDIPSTRGARREMDLGPLSGLAEAAGKRARAAAGKVDGVSAAQREAIGALAAEVIERVVWEVVPELAEAIIKEELSRLLKE